MRTKAAALAVGIVFGATLCWSGMSNPDVIRRALLLERAYLFLFFAAAVAVATVGTELLRRGHRRALFGDVPLTFSRQRPAPRHILGSLLFGVGWGVADACPGPIATQIGQAMPWAVCTLAGLVLGVALFLRTKVGETEPPVDASPSPSRKPIAVERPAVVQGGVG